MKNFTKKIRSKSIIVLLSLLSVFFVLSVTFTMSKYVIEKPVGNITLNLTSVDTLIPGLQLRNTLGTSVTEVVFGKTEDYESEIAGIEPINVDVQKKGKIKLYVNGTKAYILSDRKIYANPDCWHTFYELKELTSVDFSNFETGMVTNMRGMFRGCTKLTEVKNITSWNTKNVEDMEFLFRDCTSLTTLDLSGWNTANVTDMSHMFLSCGRLVSIYVGSGWNTDNASSSGKMFEQCKKLKGGKGTSYDSAHTDKAYARIDGGAENPGYFTDIADKP